jgi:hypothetical protein
MASRKLKLVTEQLIIPKESECILLPQNKREFRRRSSASGVTRESIFVSRIVNVDAQKILLSIESLQNTKSVAKADGPLHVKQNNSKKNKTQADGNARKSQQNTNKELDRLAEKIVKECLHMNLALSNATFRFGCSTYATPLPKHLGDFVPCYALHRDQALSNVLTMKKAEDDKRLRAFISSWMESKDQRFTLRSRAVSVSNYKYNPEKLREKVKGLLEALRLDENQDFACIDPAYLCHQVAQAALNACRLANPKSSISSAVYAPTPSRARPPTSRVPTAFSPKAKDCRHEQSSCLHAHGCMPEGVLARLSPSGSWNPALYRLQDTGDLLCLPSDGLSEMSQPRSVCSLSADLLSVKELGRATAHFPFRLVVSCARDVEGASPDPGAQAQLPGTRAITLSALSEADRERWLAAVRLFLNVPQFRDPDLSCCRRKQEQQHLVAERAERMMLKRKITAAPTPAPQAPPPAPPRLACNRAPRPCSAVPRLSKSASASATETQLPVLRPASAAM